MHLRRRRLLALLLAFCTFATACNEGRVNVYVFAKTPFNEWTAEGQHWDFMNETYDSMVVWEPYWDQRLDDFEEVMVYENAYAIKVDQNKSTIFTDHPDWVLRDAAGNPLYVPFDCHKPGGCPQYAGDLGNAEFVDHWIAHVQEFVDRGYTGLYIDDVNLLWRVSDANGNEVRPVDPRTGEEMTRAAWRGYMADFVVRVRAEFPDLEIWHNVIWYSDSPGFSAGVLRRVIESADVIHLERGMNDPGLKVGDSTFGMETFMAFIDKVHERGANVALLDTHADTVDEQWFNLAGYFLVNDGHDLISTEEWDLVSPDAFFTGFDLDLGHAPQDRFLVGTTIHRNFTDGYVVMNQPRAETTTVDLPRPLRHEATGQIVETVTLSGGEAAVFTNP